MLAEVFERISKKGISVEITDKFKEKVINSGFNPSYGARPLRRAVQSLIEDVLAEEVLSARIVSGDSIVIDAKDDGTSVVLKNDSLSENKVEIIIEKDLIKNELVNGENLK